MPLYEYACTKCGKRTERIEKFAGPNLEKCPHCGGRVEQLPSAPAIQFKGSGWYVTDYARKSSANLESKAEESSSSGDKDKSEKSDKGEKSDRSEKSERKSDSKSAEKSAASAKEKKKSKEK